jgi:hypothetical protein
MTSLFPIDVPARRFFQKFSIFQGIYHTSQQILRPLLRPATQEESWQTTWMAAYIDLNAVRAGIVEDPKAYRWCGYGEALGGGQLARKGLAVVTRSFGHGSDWRVVSRVYRKILFGAGFAVGGDPGARFDYVSRLAHEFRKNQTAVSATETEVVGED